MSSSQVDLKLMCLNLHNFLRTLGVVGVVGVLVADATNFEGPKVPNFIEKPPFLFASELSRMSTLSVQKFWTKKRLIILRNSAKHIWPHWPNSEVPEKQKLGKRSCVIVLDTTSQLLGSHQGLTPTKSSQPPHEVQNTAVGWFSCIWWMIIYYRFCTITGYFFIHRLRFLWPLTPTRNMKIIRTLNGLYLSAVLHWFILHECFLYCDCGCRQQVADIDSQANNVNIPTGNFMSFFCLSLLIIIIIIIIIITDSHQKYERFNAVLIQETFDFSDGQPDF